MASFTVSVSMPVVAASKPPCHLKFSYLAHETIASHKVFIVNENTVVFFMYVFMRNSIKESSSIPMMSSAFSFQTRISETLSLFLSFNSFSNKA